MMKQSIRRKQSDVNEQMQKLEDRLLEFGIHGNAEDGGCRAILETEPMELLRKLKEGELSAVHVLRVFQSKALEVTKKLNCITEFIPEAEFWAKQCDAIPSEERGPLHGLPVSIKESIDVQGMDTTMGLAKHLYNPVSSHAVVVEAIIKAGAVPFCKTNVPQTLLSFCCTNPVYGETKNPWDQTRTPGGSSGGEAALISAGGSVLGIGSDLAGSGRVPAGLSGCIGLRTTWNRLSSRGMKRALEGEIGVMSTAAILGKDVRIVTECMKTLVEGNEMRDLDPKVAPIPWNDLKFGLERKLIFGYFDKLDTFESSPGVKRAVYEAKIALERQGHKVVPFEIPDIRKIHLELLRIILADGGQTVKKHIENEEVDPSLKKGITVSVTPNIFKPLKKQLLRFRSPLASDIIQTRCFNSYNLWRELYSRENTISDFIKRMKDNHIDLLLSPVYAIPAPQPFVPSIVFPACIYTIMFNYLDFPSGAVPVTRENEADQQKLEEYPEHDILLRVAKQATRGAIGLPLGALVTGLPWEEELVCKGMFELQEALKNITVTPETSIS